MKERSPFKRTISFILTLILVLSFNQSFVYADEEAAGNDISAINDDSADNDAAAINDDSADTDIWENISTTTAVMSVDPNSSSENPTEQIVIESYLTGAASSIVEIKPCDIIFIMDQSKWMNTVEDEGAQRSTIISEIKALIDSFETPTTGGENRVALAGYGRVNMSANTDAYNASIYPGTKAVGGGISLNTGYYTASGKFVSANGWSDVSASLMSGTNLPQMSESYRAGMTYENAFMTIEEADEILNDDTIMAWYAGASRMDAGLTIAEQLATVANEYAKSENEDRNLIVCILSSSLPIQNTAAYNTNVIRTAAVLNAADQLKNLGATIFAFGDYHASGKTISGTVQDTEANFNYYMQQLCSSPDYFYSFFSFKNVTDALTAMIRKITIVAAGSAEVSTTVKVADIVNYDSADKHTFTWRSILDYYGSNADYILENTMVDIAYYKFNGYDADGNPTFEAKPYASTEMALSNLASIDSDYLTYTTNLVPIPALISATSDDPTVYGDKIVITIGSPVTITYQWASDAAEYAPSDAVIPDSELVVLGESHQAATVNSDHDEHYIFAGWFLDVNCTQAYTGTEKINSNLNLYGKWERYLLIDYYWKYFETGYAAFDDRNGVEYGGTPNEFIPEFDGYVFGGWYTDYDAASGTYSNAYTASPMYEDLKLYAKWIPATDTIYEVHYYKQDGDGYTEVTADAEVLTGTTDTAIAEITKVYDGFTQSRITYESSSLSAQTESITIQGDGSLVVRVYYDKIPLWNIHVTLTDDSESQTPLKDGVVGLYSKVRPEDYSESSGNSEAVDITAGSGIVTEAKTVLEVDGTTWYLVDAKLTDSSGSISWNDLDEDEYYVIQLAAPDGYDLPEATGEVIGSKRGETVEVPLINSKTELIVPTGVSLPDFALSLAIFLVGVGGLILMFKKRRRT